MHCTLFKAAIVAVNVAIFATGVALNILSISVMLPLVSELEGYLSLIEDAPQDLRQLPNVSYLIIVIAILLKPSAILGCRSAHTVTHCRLLTSTSLVLILFIVQFSAAVVLLVFETQVSGYFDETAVQMTASIGKDYGMSGSVTPFWTSTMAQWKCCGYNNYTDFTESPYVTTFNLYPPECCKNNGIHCAAVVALTDNVQGCVVPLVNHTKNTAFTVGTVALVTCLLQITAMVLSMLFYKKAIKGKEASRPVAFTRSESPEVDLPVNRL